jgi:hypothetical protein
MLLLAGVIALLVGAGIAAQPAVSYANIATAYAAKQTCSCRFVSGRPLDSCLADFPDDARGQLSVSEDGDHFRASALYGTFKAEAVYEEGFGCRLLSD